MSAATFAAAQVLRALPRATIGRAFGRLADYRWSPALEQIVVGAYARIYGISFEECTQSSGWATFDDFFTRELRPEARPVDPDPRTVVSPADGTVETAVSVRSLGILVVKGRTYRVADLLGDEGAQESFSDALAWVIYLSPRDYHRVHAPVGGTIVRIRSMAGEYYPVNAVGTRHVTNLFGRNRRVAIELDAEGGLGRVIVVMVGAMMVGRITTIGVAGSDVPVGEHVFNPPVGVQRGQEMGVFHLGSTVVVLVEQARNADAVRSGGVVRYGQSLWRAPDTSERGTRGQGFATAAAAGASGWPGGVR
ncbi:MAG: archaetidylserine decarboxylase [Polyangiaceae bacterium]|jgi:phosphatidylserine decarboxylase